MPRVGLQILLESMSLVQCRKSNICLKRPGRILGRRKTPIPRVMVAKPPLQIRGRSDITLLRIVYRSKNVCVEHSIIIPQKPSAALLRVSLETATEGILRSLLLSRPLFEDGVPSVADLLRKSRRMVGARGFEPPTFCSQSRRTTRLCNAPCQKDGRYYTKKSVQVEDALVGAAAELERDVLLGLDKRPVDKHVDKRKELVRHLRAPVRRRF